MPKSKRTTMRADHLLTTCAILQSIAENCPARSRERKAVRDAAEALVFVTRHEQLKTSYDKFRRAAKRGPTRAREQTLRSAGITP
jgi:hypothetical protein